MATGVTKLDICLAGGGFKSSAEANLKQGSMFGRGARSETLNRSQEPVNVFPVLWSGIRVTAFTGPSPQPLRKRIPQNALPESMKWAFLNCLHDAKTLSQDVSVKFCCWDFSCGPNKNKHENFHRKSSASQDMYHQCEKYFMLKTCLDNSWRSLIL